MHAALREKTAVEGRRSATGTAATLNSFNWGEYFECFSVITTIIKENIQEHAHRFMSTFEIAGVFRMHNLDTDLESILMGNLATVL